MSQRKISECISVRINVGNYQHIELTKYAEESIEYSSEKERIEKEDQLTNDLVVSLRRSMKSIPEKLGKGIDQAIQVEESISKAIPEWLATSAIPNIANGAEKKHIQVVAEQKQKKDESTANLAEVVKPEAKVETKVETKAVEAEESLFEDDTVEEPVKEVVKEVVKETVKEVVKVEKVESVKSEDKASSGELEGFFDDDDDDLFA